MNVCGACGLDFGSVDAFDRHRVGTFDPITRRCLSLADLKSGGFVSNVHGRLTTREAIERGRTLRHRGARAVV